MSDIIGQKVVFQGALVVTVVKEVDDDQVVIDFGHATAVVLKEDLAVLA